MKHSEINLADELFLSSRQTRINRHKEPLENNFEQFYKLNAVESKGPCLVAEYGISDQHGQLVIKLQ